MAAMALNAASLRVTRASQSVRELKPRGGASMAASGPYGVIIFGGADRGQSHFNDMAILQRNKRDWRKREGKGDLPTPRSGHAAVCYGKYMFLFGGIDFTEEAAYNDLYVLDMQTLEWRYVGESGVEIPARNSHSLGIIYGEEGRNHIVIYGGASPDLGPLGETYFAALPDMDVIASSEFYLTWQEMPSSALAPAAREMHSTCASPDGGIIIAGGRDEQGTVLSDVWELASAAAEEGQPAGLAWRKRNDLTLDVPRCAHGAAIVFLPPDKMPHMALVGGFSGLTGASAMPDHIRIISTVEGDASAWRVADCGGRSVGPRFGVAVCNSPSWIPSYITLLEQPTPPSSPSAKSESGEDIPRASFDFSPTEAAAASAAATPSTPAAAEAGRNPVKEECTFEGLLLFGGVNVERDFSDVWFISPHTD